MVAEKYGPNRLDALLTQTVALPAAAGSVYTTAFDLGHVNPGAAPRGEIEIIIPALNTARLPDTKIAKYRLQDSAAGSSFADLEVGAIDRLQTGASSSGDVADNVRRRIPPCERYLRLAITTDARVWAWGHNHRGQLGDGTKNNRNTCFQSDTRNPFCNFR